MGFALHLLHVAILAIGVVGVWAMLRPTVTSGRTVAALRRDALGGTLADAALRRAMLTERLPVARPRPAARVLHAYAVAAAAVTATVSAEWAIGVRVSAWTVLVALLAVFAAAGWYLGRPRPAEHVVVVAAFAAWLTHAVLLSTASLDAGGSVSRVLGAVLFCHPVGTAAPRVSVLGYVVRPASSGGAASWPGLLAVASACLATACVAGWCNRQATRAAWLRMRPAG